MALEGIRNCYYLVGLGGNKMTNNKDIQKLLNESFKKVNLKKTSNKNKHKCIKMDISLKDALDILDYDKKMKASHADEKRGAIYTIRKLLEIRQSMILELLEVYDTCQCKLYFYKTRAIVMNECLFVLVSIHKNKEKINVRFGNRCQIDTMLKSYRNKEVL